jgi:hypothetical protein
MIIGERRMVHIPDHANDRQPWRICGTTELHPTTDC